MEKRALLSLAAGLKKEYPDCTPEQADELIGLEEDLTTAQRNWLYDYLCYGVI